MSAMQNSNIFRLKFNTVPMLLAVSVNLLVLASMANCELQPGTVTPNPNSLGTNEQELNNILNLLPKSFRESARSYIASRLRKIVMTPALQAEIKESESQETNIFNSNRKRAIRNPMLGTVPVIPEDQPSPKWVPGELIASNLSKMQLRLINESVFGPLKSATMFPSVMSTILVFNKRYDPERLAQVLKFNFGIEAEPNGLILEASPS